MKSRRFGVELEFTTSYEDVKKILQENFNEKVKFIHNYKKTTSRAKKFELKTDITTGCELASPAMTMKDIDVLKDILNCLKKEGVEVSEQDGFHVHMEVKDVPLENLLASWLGFEHIVKKCFPYKRVRTIKKFKFDEEMYCESYVKKISNKKVAYIFSEAFNCCLEKNRSISFRDYYDKGTVEIRLANGTLDYIDVRRWVEFCLKLAEYASSTCLGDLLEVTTNEYSIYSISKEMNLNKTLDNWLRKKYYEV